jgi:hypothetical protein
MTKINEADILNIFKNSEHAYAVDKSGNILHSKLTRNERRRLAKGGKLPKRRSPANVLKIMLEKERGKANGC